MRNFIMKMSLTFLFFLMTMLVSCVSNPVDEQNRATKLMAYKIQTYGPACETLGFEKDTNLWRECIQREYEQKIIRQQYQWNTPYWNPYYFPRPYYYRH